jgi:hypothetical protein
MSLESISLRAAAISIVYGWLCLLAFALTATAIRAKGQPDEPPVHKTTVAPAQLGANGAVAFRAAQHDRGQTPGSISSR